PAHTAEWLPPDPAQPPAPVRTSRPGSRSLAALPFPQPMSATATPEDNSALRQSHPDKTFPTGFGRQHFPLSPPSSIVRYPLYCPWPAHLPVCRNTLFGNRFQCFSVG